ncbi:hypothetical protein HOU10_gp40 [Curvibacter phage P26059B]|uniref:Uncharacterized protein n=1 Tax=Curvibacter phage P26059B TaxID=1983784 RepID=A0A384V0Y8_9CAUD|nr:hypothetical protein HOU10_gp40 [Curvibacter phage P26059B]ASJ79316.1 hypothetical protein P26059B_0040 [Curvibacter phage P26059B]
MQGRAGTLAYLGQVAGLVGAIEGLGGALADSAREWAICFFAA